MAGKRSEQLKKELANEVGKLRDLAVTSSDPLIVAKAVAASDSGVQQLIIARLIAGERLVEVFVLPNATELQVFFRFITTTEIPRLVDAGILAFVDSHKGEVVSTIDPFILQPERRIGRPFVDVTSASASALAEGNEPVEPLVDRERAFFRNIGLRGFGIGFSTDTVCNTDTTSTTWSGQPYKPDDTGQEGTSDYCDSRGPILTA